MYYCLNISALQVFCVILDMMSVCFVDPSAIKTLIAMYKDFKSRGLIFCLADCSGKINWFHFLFLGLFNNAFFNRLYSVE
jgi:hypothetical protein